MTDRPWEHEERQAARLLNGTRHPASSGGRVDVEGPGIVTQVKYLQQLSGQRTREAANDR